MALSTVDTNKWRSLLDRESWKSDATRKLGLCGDSEPEIRTIRQQQRRLTRTQVKRLAARYEEGATVYELAEEFVCSRATVSARLKKVGVPMRRQSPTSEQVDEMVRLYESGMSLKGVADQLDFSVRTVQSRLHEHGFRRGILVAQNPK